MPTNIKCPHCSHEFPLEDALNDELKEAIEKEKNDLRQQMVDYKKTKDEELKRKDLEFQLKLREELKKQQEETETAIRKSTRADFETRLQALQEANRDHEEKLKLARQKELEYLRREQELKNREAEIDIELQKKLQAERTRLAEELRQIEEQKLAVKETEYQLQLKELKKQLADQKALAEEMRRKAEQGSTQLQGEIQELALEEMLRAAFPFDLVAEVGKGVRGADSVLTVRNQLGQECGRIIFESKRAKNFSKDWVEKLKADMRSQGADLAVLVTQTMPDDLPQFGEKEGIWICNFNEVRAL
ncbi:MAG: DUF2130 domain-containing protein, partial [Flavihumibacter sp.]